MSRVGKKPIPLPKGVKISIGDKLQVEGPKGKLSVPIPQGIYIEQADGSLHIKRESDNHAALHGLSALTAAGALLGATGGAMLNWLRHRATLTPKRFAL